LMPLINARETEGAIKNGQRRETGNIDWKHRVHKTQDETKQNKIEKQICVGHHHAQDTR
jgi:hypothetical protein